MKHKPFTRILSLLLAMATLVGLLAVPASAASLNDSGSVTIQYLGRHEYLSKSTGGTLGGSSWTYASNDGLSGRNGVLLTSDYQTGKDQAPEATAFLKELFAPGSTK